MYKKVFLFLFIHLLCFYVKAEERINPNFFTQFEPEAFNKSYTSITSKMADFQKNSGYDAKIFNLFASKPV